MTKPIPLEWKLIKYKLGDLHEWEKNPVQINEREAKELAKSLKKFNQDLPYVAAAPPNGKAGLPLLDGHQRKMVEVQINGKPLSSLVPVLVPNRALSDKEKQEWVIRHRKNTGEFDFDKLANYFDVPDLLEWGFSEKELQIGGFEFEDTTQDAEPIKTLANRFGVPPFSVLDARQGYWQDRKRAWIALGLKGELGRGDALLLQSKQVTTDGLNYYRNLSHKATAKDFGSGGAGELSASYKSQSRQTAFMKSKGKTLGAIANNQTGDNGILSRTGKYATDNGLLGESEQARSHYIKAKNVNGLLGESFPTIHPYDDYQMKDGSVSQTGTSIFDPVLSELLYRWFMPVGGHVLNPMSGEATHGIVAGYLGYKFTGVELRDEQAESNRQQAKQIGVKNVKWITADALTIDKLKISPADFVVSCPPYADLEVYSDNPLDISTMDYKDFITVYSEIIRKSCNKLRDDRFAAFVVGEVRDKKGIYYDFVGDTIKAFKAAGMKYYNEMILVTSVGSLPIRAGRQFDSGRKIGKTHQNVLVFLKGDSKRAVQACGHIEMELPDGFELNQDD